MCESRFDGVMCEELETDLIPNQSKNINMKNKVLNLNFKLNSLDEKIENSLREAYFSTEDLVSKHKWLGKEINFANRIGYFVNYLRRDFLNWVDTIPYTSTSDGLRLHEFFYKFLNVKNWNGVCIPKIDSWNEYDNFKFEFNYLGDSWEMNGEKIKYLTDKAREISSSEQFSEDINKSLAELQLGMYNFMVGIDKSKEINQQAEKIINQLTEIVLPN